jgi:hypothetical protein
MNKGNISKKVQYQRVRKIEVLTRKCFSCEQCRLCSGLAQARSASAQVYPIIGRLGNLERPGMLMAWVCVFWVVWCLVDPWKGRVYSGENELLRVGRNMR